MPKLKEAWQKTYDRIMRSGVSSVGAHEFHELIADTAKLEAERDAWMESFVATRAYYFNNNGPNATRYRAAVKQLKEMKLIK